MHDTFHGRSAMADGVPSPACRPGLQTPLITSVSATISAMHEGIPTMRTLVLATMTALVLAAAVTSPVSAQGGGGGGGGNIEQSFSAPGPTMTLAQSRERRRARLEQRARQLQAR